MHVNWYRVLGLILFLLSGVLGLTCLGGISYATYKVLFGD